MKCVGTRKELRLQLLLQITRFVCLIFDCRSLGITLKGLENTEVGISQLKKLCLAEMQIVDKFFLFITDVRFTHIVNSLLEIEPKNLRDRLVCKQIILDYCVGIII